jgi:F-type H+-transporting ATPase subunit epsilon
MKLKVLLPSEVLIDEKVAKVVAEAENGYFCLLPRHIDFLAALAPGLLSFVTLQDVEQFLAVDQGILIKCGPDVLVSTRNAVWGPDLGSLEQTVRQRFRALDDREKMARSAFAKLEANFIRRFMELEEHG